MREKIEQLICAATGMPECEVSVPEREGFGHFSANLALRLAKEAKRPPMDLAKEISEKVLALAPKGFFERVEAAPPGFVNFWVSKKAWAEMFARVAENDSWGMTHRMKGQTVMVEYTDPNPFKLFHIGHLMTNAIGESIARLYEGVGAKVLRVNYQGDVGLHVAKAVWAIMKQDRAISNMYPDTTPENIVYDWREELLNGKAYSRGNRAYEENEEARKEIDEVNKKIYDRSDPDINKRYDEGRRKSLELFKEIYVRLGTKFDHYFFESEIGDDGLKIVADHPEVFVKSEGAIIFKGEEHNLHTRVFVNAKGLPTYEAKELGLNKKKFELYSPDISIVVTANEINEYFKVLMKAMALVLPEVAERTRHVGHGFLRLPGGKMSSRTGNVITAESLIEQVKEKIKEKERDRESEQPRTKNQEPVATREQVAIGVIKYSILRQSPGQDIVFDFEKSISLEGDSGPYLQYAYARLASVLRKAGDFKLQTSNFEPLESEAELALVRKILEFPDVVDFAAERLLPSHAAHYLSDLAALVNRFYHTSPIIQEKNEALRDARLALAGTAAGVLKRGLHLLGIQAPEQI